MRIFGLIGFPLLQSSSPELYARIFSREQITDAEFRLFPMQSANELLSLTGTVTGLSGLAVTIPHKESVIPYLNKLDPITNAIGAVNCIQCKTRELIGYNTDWQGFLNSLRPLLGNNSKKALVLGSGGASKAVQYALRLEQIDYDVVSRTPDHNQLGYPELSKKRMNDSSIIINCTPVGMSPKSDEAPDIPYQYLSDRHLCYDLVYRPSETLFLRKSKERGARIKNGREMLEIQAELNWRIWNNR